MGLDLRCQQCVNSILSCICSRPARFPTLRTTVAISVFPSSGEFLEVLGISWSLSCTNVHFALVPRSNSWCPMSFLFPQRPHMLMPVYTTRRPSIPEPALLMQPRTETPDRRLQSHSTSPPRSPKVSLRPPGGLPGAQEVPTADPPQPARQPCVRAHSLVVQQRAERPCIVSLEGPRLAPRAMGWDTPRHHPSVLRRTPIPLSATHWQTIPKCTSRLQARNVPRWP